MGEEPNQTTAGKAVVLFTYCCSMYASSLPDTGPFFIQPDNNICSIEKLYKIHNGNRDVIIRHLNINQLWKRVGVPRRLYFPALQ